MDGRTALFELLMAGFFAVACLRAHGPIASDSRLTIGEFLRLLLADEDHDRPGAVGHVETHAAALWKKSLKLLLLQHDVVKPEANLNE